MTPLEAFGEIRRVVDKSNCLSVHEVIKLVEEKFTSTNSKSVPCCDVCGRPLRSDGDCASRIAHLYGE
jgi:hypothetical protein